MFTRCMHCDAVFRVTLEQLQTSGGRVRCGVCEEVFDAFLRLTALDPNASPATSAGSERPEAVDAGTKGLLEAESSGKARPLPGNGDAHFRNGGNKVAGATGGAASGVNANLKSIDAALLRLTASASDIDYPPDDANVPRLPTASTETSRDSARRLYEESRPDVGQDKGSEHLDLPPALLSAPRTRMARKPLRRGLVAQAAFAAAIVLLLGGILVQAFIFFRGEIAVAWPGSRGAMDRICRVIGCTNPLPRLTDKLVIESSDLQALDPARPNRVVLMANLHNTAASIQAWPTLELTLLDGRENPSATRILEPEEYLPSNLPATAGMPANAEVEIRLQLDTGSLEAVGYRLFLFHR